MLSILQGDQINVPITLTLGAQTLTDADVETVRVKMGNLLKTYPGDITFRDGAFLMPLSQTETFAMPPGTVPVVVRIKFKNKSIRGHMAFSSVNVTVCPDKELP